MRARRLVSQSPEISVLGFGSWALGGPWKFGWGPSDDDEGIAAIRHAIDSGVTWIDTAAVYGYGHSEEVVGRAVERYRAGEEVLVFTKCGEPWLDAAGRTHGDGLRPDSIREECEYSLRRLGVERIDLYQFHWPDTRTGTPVEESWGTMAELADEGKIRWAGVCNFSPDLLERCEPIRHVDSVQPPLSLLHPEAREDVIPWALEHGSGVIAYSPMASGLLTGAFDRERLDKLAPDDWRRHAADFQEPELSRALRIVDGLRPIAERLRCSLPTLAVAWALTVPGVTGAIVGARRPAQVDDWLPAGELDLDEETLAEIEQLIAA
ncbi:MAG TPA: aldo/keto reductase [Gaiellaceae bacterium]|nr:aldo/keto reductase [Gaiellaceae bacterium]